MLFDDHPKHEDIMNQTIGPTCAQFVYHRGDWTEACPVIGKVLKAFYGGGSSIFDPYNRDQKINHQVYLYDLYDIKYSKEWPNQQGVSTNDGCSGVTHDNGLGSRKYGGASFRIGHPACPMYGVRSTAAGDVLFGFV